MSAVKIATLDSLISGERYDPILIVGKTIGLEWATVRALILLRLGPEPGRVAPPDIESARVNFRAPDALDRRARRRASGRQGNRLEWSPSSRRKRLPRQNLNPGSRRGSVATSSW